MKLCKGDLVRVRFDLSRPENNSVLFLTTYALFCGTQVVPADDRIPIGGVTHLFKHRLDMSKTQVCLKLALLMKKVVYYPPYTDGCVAHTYAFSERFEVLHNVRANMAVVRLQRLWRWKLAWRKASQLDCLPENVRAGVATALVELRTKSTD